MADLLASIDNTSDEDKQKIYASYETTGNFERDFIYLSLLRGIKLSIGNRLKLPVLPREADNGNGGDRKTPDRSNPLQERSKLTSSRLSQASMEEPNPSSEKENESPHTYAIVADSKAYFKPRLQVETESDQKDHKDHKDQKEQKDLKEQKEHVISLYLRGWKADVRVIEVFSRTLPQLNKLTVLNMWNAGLDNETMMSLAQSLLHVPSLKSLCLDANSFVTDQVGNFMNSTCSRTNGFYFVSSRTILFNVE